MRTLLVTLLFSTLPTIALAQNFLGSLKIEVSVSSPYRCSPTQTAFNPNHESFKTNSRAANYSPCHDEVLNSKAQTETFGSFVTDMRPRLIGAGVKVPFGDVSSPSTFEFRVRGGGLKINIDIRRNFL